MSVVLCSLNHSNLTSVLILLSQALQAPACHENLVKVGGYILGEFGNLIAGDPRSRYHVTTLRHELSAFLV